MFENLKKLKLAGDRKFALCWCQGLILTKKKKVVLKYGGNSTSVTVMGVSNDTYRESGVTVMNFLKLFSQST